MYNNFICSVKSVHWINKVYTFVCFLCPFSPKTHRVCCHIMLSFYCRCNRVNSRHCAVSWRWSLILAPPLPRLVQQVPENFLCPWTCSEERNVFSGYVAILVPWWRTGAERWDSLLSLSLRKPRWVKIILWLIQDCPLNIYMFLWMGHLLRHHK